MLDEARIASATYKILVRHRDMDPITLSEKVAERIMWMQEDSGEDAGTAPSVAAAKEKSYQPPKREIPRPPIPSQEGQRLVIGPDDPEFAKAEAQFKIEHEKPIQARRVSQLATPTGAQNRDSSVQYWTVETLSDFCHKNFPVRVAFTPDGLPPEAKAVAIRDVKAVIHTIPPNGVRVIYRPSNEGDGGIHLGTDVGEVAGVSQVNIPRAATILFSCGDADIDVQRAMASITDQLRGIFRVRPQNMEPGYLPPPPMDSWNAFNPGMKDADSVRGTGRWSVVGSETETITLPSGNSYNVTHNTNEQVSQVVQLNRNLGTPGARAE